jgi:chromosome segregation ATPase
MSDMIVVNQTYGIWNALYEATEEKMKHLEDEIATLKETDALMQAQIDALQTSLNALMEIVSGHTTAIEQNTVDITNLRNVFNDNITSINSRLTSLEGRVSALEAIPLAIHKYRENETYIRSQLTWNTIGQLYQVANEFTTTTEPMSDHVDNGDIVPIVNT